MLCTRFTLRQTIAIFGILLTLYFTTIPQRGLSYMRMKLKSYTGNSQIIRHCLAPRQIALTFDDGVIHPANKLIREEIELRNSRGTFFINGFSGWDNSCIYDEENVQFLRQALEDGHHIASHTWQHSNLALMDEQHIRCEMRVLEDAFRKILGIRPKYMRPPFGAINDRAIMILEEMKYKIVMWDVIAYANNNVETIPVHPEPQKYYDHVIEKNLDNAIVLLHETKYNVASGPDRYGVDVLRNAGYNLTTIGQCIGDVSPLNWYEQVSDPQPRDQSWYCDREGDIMDSCSRLPEGVK